MGILPNNSLGVGASGSRPAGDLAAAVVIGSFAGVGPSAPFAFQGWANLAIWATVTTTLTTTAGSLSASVSSGTGIAAGGSVNSVNVPPGTTWGTFSGTSGTLALPPLTFAGSIDESGVITGMASTTGLLGATVTRPSGSAAPALAAGTTVSAILSATSVLLSLAPTSFATLNVQNHFIFAPTGNAVLGGTDANAVFTGPALTWSGTVEFERSFDGGATWICCNLSSGALAQYTGGPVNTSWNEPERGVCYRFNCTAYSSGTINYRMSQTSGGAMSLTTGGYAY